MLSNIQNNISSAADTSDAACIIFIRRSNFYEIGRATHLHDNQKTHPLRLTITYDQEVCRT